MKAIERFIQYLDEKGIKPTRFEKDAGLSNGYLGTQKKRNADLGEGVIIKIIDYCRDLNIDWLLTGNGSMLRDQEEQCGVPTVQETFPLRTDHNVKLQTVPLYELDATAGLVALFNASSRQAPVSHIQIPDLPPCDGALYVRGDSMYPLLKSGDIILYKEIASDTRCILWGEMYLLSFVMDGETYITIKYIQRGDDDAHVRLVSQNPHHSPQDIPADSIRALALVKASIRFNTMG